MKAPETKYAIKKVSTGAWLESVSFKPKYKGQHYLPLDYKPAVKWTRNLKNALKFYHFHQADSFLAFLSTHKYLTEKHVREDIAHNDPRDIF